MNSNVRIFPFAPCANNPNLMPGASQFVAVVGDDSMCPIAGRDRCNDGNTLQSWMVAVDDTDPNHVYAAYALPSGANNTAILVQDFTKSSPTGALASAGGPVRIDPGTTTQRFMPWVCSTGGAAFVSWYDRGAAIGAPRNDLSDYLLGSVLGRGGSLSAGPIVNLSGNPDPQCKSGFPCGSRGDANAMACMVAPTSGGGCPKYGDYNGNACAAGRVYTAWASATPPATAPTDLPPVTEITIFFASTQAPAGTVSPTTLTVNKILMHPDHNHLRLFNLKIDGVTVRANINAGSTGPRTVRAGNHTVSETGGTGTILNTLQFHTVISGDRATDGTVNLAPHQSKICTITNYDHLGGCPSNRRCCDPGTGTDGCRLCVGPQQSCP